MIDSYDLLFSTNDTAVFMDSTTSNKTKANKKWKILIIDDEQEVHNVTKLVLSNFVFEGKSLEFISGYSGKEALQLIAHHPDTALILLDVVMEEDDTGLKVTKYIREELKNNLVRIILRTGQPGQAPEKSVILNYDINDYKEKTELTSQKLFTSVVSCLRSYRDIIMINSNRKGLRKIVDSFSSIFDAQSMKEFASAVLVQLASILNPGETSQKAIPSSFAAVKNNDDFYILAGSGEFAGSINLGVSDAATDDILVLFNSALESKKNIFFDNHLVIYFKSKTGSDIIAYFNYHNELSDLDKDLIEIFCSNVSAVNESIINSSRYESEKHQRLLSNTLRELYKKLTSTLDLKEVLKRLLESLEKFVTCDSVIALLKNGDLYDLFVSRGYQNTTAGSQIDISIDETLFEIVETGLPLLISDTRKDPRLIDSCIIPRETRSLMGIPIMHRENLFALIILQSFTPNTFSVKEEGIAFTFANQAGIALENARLFEEMTKRNIAIKNLLNNAGQGFLSFGEDLLINKEYSYECLNIFQDRIENKRFSDLIYPHDIEQNNFLKMLLVKILHEQNESTRSIYMTLLPEEIVIYNKNIHIQYKLLDTPSNNIAKAFMVILTDITEKRFLETRMELEKNTLKMMVKVIVQYKDFVDCLRDYKSFCEYGIDEILESGHSFVDIVFEIFRSIHTFKGTFAHLAMFNTVQKLHDFETLINLLQNNLDDMILDDLKQFFYQFDMLGWIDQDLNLLKEILGENFINRGQTITVEKWKLLDIEKKMMSTLSQTECELLLPDIRRLRHVPFKDLLVSYSDYVIKLAEKREKSINPLNIDGGNFLVDPDRYNNFARSLVHIFNNIIEHGIESIGERLERGKEDTGNIECNIVLSNNVIILLITDDGHGINIDSIKEVAVAKGICGSEEIECASYEKILNLIFEDNFSTKNIVTQLSGRGFGLSAVKDEVEKMGGTVEVKTSYGRWTQFSFVIPYYEV